MVIHKLKGFVKDEQAKLRDVSRERVVMQLRGAGLTGYFGSSPDRQGLEIELRMEVADRSSVTQKMKLSVVMRPCGWIRDANAFRDRTRDVMRTLKQYFAAE
jgi:hypothetical protein